MNPIIVTVSSATAHPGLTRLKRSIERHGWQSRHLTLPWQGFKTKLIGTRDALPSLKAEGFTHIVFLDAYDTIVEGNPLSFGAALALAGYNGAGALLSCEKACWPDQSLSSQYPTEFRSEYKHINSGGYISEIDFAGDVLLAGCDEAGDDQLFMTLKYLEELKSAAPRILRDDGCQIFQCMGHTYSWPHQKWQDFFEIKDDRVWNRVTGTAPWFWHAHGGGAADGYHSWLPGYKS